MPPENLINTESPCPCGSGLQLLSCCLPFIEGAKTAPTAEALMRSRYTAHARLAIDYLWDTWSAEQRIRSSKQEILNWASTCEWLKLDIISTQKGREADNEGFVSFVAFYRANGKLEQHQEQSLFKKIMGRWYYVDHA